MTWHLLSPEGRAPAPLVAELQGWYGAYSFSEQLLQKIWLRGEFDGQALRTTDGRRVRVKHPGKWNLLGGPDFKGARLAFDDGREITGDVELHLHASGWSAHGHLGDREYDAVILHVVLFPPATGHITRGANGHSIPVVALLPVLHHDLEQFAAQDALESLANRPTTRIFEELGKRSALELSALLRRHAVERWKQKVHFARVRLDRLGWAEACHHAALEILGFRFNRVPMLRVATARPLFAWTDPAFDCTAIFSAENWSLHGIRPANHPRIRLGQYANWARLNPRWPQTLLEISRQFPAVPAAAMSRTGRQRRLIAKLRRAISACVCMDQLPGTRLDNLVADGFLPLLTAHTGADLQGIWFQWYPGDQPPIVRESLRMLGMVDPHVRPLCHGLVQGLLGWLFESERQASAPDKT